MEAEILSVAYGDGIDAVTPSPEVHQSRHCDETNTPLFNGCGQPEKSGPLSSGYIKNGFLFRLLHNEEPEHGLFQSPIITLFGYKFINATALVEQRQKLFYLLRQTIAEFECKLTENASSQFPQVNVSEDSWFYYNIRKQCSHFLLYIVSFIVRFPFLSCEEKFSSDLKTAVGNLWNFLGPISNLPNSSFLKLHSRCSGSTSSVQLTPASQWLHLHLEIKLAIIEVLIRLYSSHDPKSIDDLTNIEETSRTLLVDLVYTSTHVNFSPKTGNAVVETSPFLCQCVQDLWVIMIQLLECHSRKHGTKSFWTIFTNILNSGILQKDIGMKNELGVEISFKHPVLSCWWLLVHVAPLYWYNENGRYAIKENACVAENWVLVLDLLNLSFQFKETKLDEVVSRCYLSSCLQLCRHWRPNNNVIVYLWEYFQKRMNDTFHVTGQGLQHLACARDMPYQWFWKILQRCQDPLLSNEHDTSFHLFLRIVALHSKRLKVPKAQGWKQLKGRFYSKFHKKRMEELSEQGLSSFFSLFLTLARVGELEDAANKMMSFLELLDFQSLDTNRQYCIWKGYFALLFMYKYQRTKMGYIAQNISKIFADICRSYRDIHQDKTQRHSTWNLISIYLECTQELFEYKSDECLGDYKLIDEGFGILFSLSGEKELQSLVAFTQAVLVIVSNELQTRSAFKSALAQSLWQHIFPHIRQHITDPVQFQMGESHMTNLIVSFTLLSIEHPPTSSPDGKTNTFHDLVCQFGTKDSIPASVSCKFLGSLLTSPEALELVQSGDYQTGLIHTWFRCCIQVSPQAKHLQDFTRIVFLKFPEIGKIIKVQRSIVAGNVETALLTFIKSLGEAFSSLELLSDTVVFRQKALVYFGDAVKYMESSVKQAGPLDMLRLSYKVAACLVKECPKIIYKKTQHNCLLPQIIDQLVLPVNPKKQCPHSIIQCIKLNLTEFLEGLANLDFRRDGFIKRKITQIFATYFHRFNQECYSATPAASTIKNPFVEVLSGTLSAQVSQDASDFRQYVLTLINEKYLVIPRLTKELIPTLCYLKDLFGRTCSPSETARNTPAIILEILLCLLTATTIGAEEIQREATIVLQLMLEACQKAQDLIARSALLPLLIDFINSNINQIQGAIFKVLTTVAKFDRELVLELIPSAKEAIIDSENRRGVGSDAQLRYDH